MQPPPYRYFIMTPTGEYYRVENDGNVVADATAVPVSNEAWKDTRLGYKRMPEEHGIFGTLVSDLRFVEDAATILRYIVNTMGVGAKANLRFEVLNIDFDGNGWQYNLMEEGALDFAAYNDEKDRVTITMKETGMVARYRERKDTVYEIPILINGDGVVLVDMEGFELRNQLNYILTGRDGESGWQYANRVVNTHVYTVSEADFDPGAAQSVYMPFTGTLPIYQGLEGNSVPSHETVWDYQAVGQQQIAIHYKQRFQYKKDSSSYEDIKLRVKYWLIAEGEDTPYANDFIFIDNDFYGTTERVVDIDATTPQFTMNDGDRLYVMWSVYPENPANGFAFVGWEVGEMNLVIDKVIPTTQNYHLLYRSYFSQLSDLLFEGTDTSLSHFFQESDPDFDSRPYYLGVTCGTELRGLRYNIDGLPVLAPVLAASMSDLYKDISARYAVGLGFENGKIVLERLQKFYDATTPIMDLGVVSDYSEAPALEYLGNALRAGQKQVQYDKVNGRFESITDWLWKLPDNIKTGEINEQHTFRSDPYGVEYLRALVGKPTTDNEGDNTIFVNELGQDVSGGVIVDLTKLAKNQSDVSGTYDPFFIYNIGLTPKRDLLRRGCITRSRLQGLEAQQITLQTTDKNRDLVSKVYGLTVDEDEAVSVGDLATPLFKPWIQKFTAIQTINLPEIIAANPYGYFTFTANGKERKGFLMEVQMKPNIESALEWTFLCHPDSPIG